MARSRNISIRPDVDMKARVNAANAVLRAAETQLSRAVKAKKKRPGTAGALRTVWTVVTTVAHSVNSLPRGEAKGKRSPKGGSVASWGGTSPASSHRLAWVSRPHARPEAAAGSA